jgi:hypothetical protein
MVLKNICNKSYTFQVFYRRENLRLLYSGLSCCIILWRLHSVTTQKATILFGIRTVDHSGFDYLWGHLIFSINIILPATLWPWGQSGLYQKWVPGIFLGVKGGWRIRLMISPPSVSQMSRKCGILNISQPYGTPGLLQRKLYLFFFF